LGSTNLSSTPALPPTSMSIGWETIIPNSTINIRPTMTLIENSKT
jgi:hypothetical protein